MTSISTTGTTRRLEQVLLDDLGAMPATSLQVLMWLHEYGPQTLEQLARLLARHRYTPGDSQEQRLLLDLNAANGHWTYDSGRFDLFHVTRFLLSDAVEAVNAR
jgi:hypothetical protein